MGRYSPPVIYWAWRQRQLGYPGAGVGTGVSGGEYVPGPDPVIPDTTAPTITSSGSFTQAENGAFSTTLTANETVTWSKIGGADAGLFTLTGATLALAAKDYEIPADADSNNVYVVQVRATDTAGNQTDQTISVTITNVAEGGAYPVFTSSAAQTVDENEPFSLSLTTDISSTFSVVGGADAALFDLSGSTVDADEFDYELPEDADGDNIYEFTVRATSVADPSKYTDQNITLTVSDVVEATGNSITWSTADIQWGAANSLTWG